jgi:hypothetical protein
VSTEARVANLSSAELDAERPIEADPIDRSRLVENARALKEQLVTQTRSVATAALSGARGGLLEADRRLKDEESWWNARADEAALPDVLGKDPMGDLATRVERESDYWRTFAVRSLRPGAARNLGIAGAVLALVSGLLLGTLGALAAIFGSEGPGLSALVTAAGVAVCAIVACALGVVSERGRMNAAREALVRADQAERRLERVAAILALKAASPAKFVEALSRLERER